MSAQVPQIEKGLLARVHRGVLGWYARHRRDRSADHAGAVVQRNEQRLILPLDAVPVRAANVGGGDDSLHAGQGAGATRVNAEEARVRVRTALGAPDQHPRRGQINAVLDRAGDFLECIHPADWLADNLVIVIHLWRT